MLTLCYLPLGFVLAKPALRRSKGARTNSTNLCPPRITDYRMACPCIYLMLYSGNAADRNYMMSGFLRAYQGLLPPSCGLIRGVLYGLPGHPTNLKLKSIHSRSYPLLRPIFRHFFSTKEIFYMAGFYLTFPDIAPIGCTSCVRPRRQLKIPPLTSSFILSFLTH